MGERSADNPTDLLLAHGVGNRAATERLLPLVYEDLRKLFKEIVDKDYTEDLYTKQFSLYIDNIVGRIDLQAEAYGKEENVPAKLFEVLGEQKQGLLALKEKHGPIVTPDKLQDRT